MEAHLAVKQVHYVDIAHDVGDHGVAEAVGHRELQRNVFAGVPLAPALGPEALEESAPGHPLLRGFEVGLGDAEGRQKAVDCNLLHLGHYHRLGDLELPITCALAEVWVLLDGVTDAVVLP